MFATCAILLSLASLSANQVTIKRFGDSSGASAVRVEQAALVHTTQLMASAAQLESATSESRDVFRQLALTLKTFESTTADLIKLNVYVDSAPAHAAVLDSISKWPADRRPATSFVTTAIRSGRRLAIDAVFVDRRRRQLRNVAHQLDAAETKAGATRRTLASVLPKGDVVYVSGQAQAGNLSEATTATMQGLRETLHSMKLRTADIVQVKCFLQPMKDAAIVEAAIGAFFGEKPVPAVAYVEWIAGNTRPIEIELVVAAPLTKTEETVSYYTPPDLKASPVFSRVARIHGNRRIYTSGIVADGAAANTSGEKKKASESDDARAQVHSVFEKLIRLLKPARANLRHLAKATYYVTDAEVSGQLGKIRPHYYDPARPPAASKATVQGVAAKGRRFALDIIAAPEAPLHSVLQPLAESLKPTSIAVYKSIKSRSLRLHIFEPPGHRSKDSRPVFLAIHGGGWTGGNVRTFYPFADHFAKQGMLGVSLEYRLKRDTDGTTVFDCVRDARSAVRWIRRHAAELGADPNRIVVMGGSAGGHLAVSTALFRSVNETGESTDISAKPNALILMYPVIDTSSEGYGQQKIGERWRELSPLHNVRKDIPPTLIFHGTGDAVTPYMGAQRFHQRATVAGASCQLVTKPGGRHGYIIFGQAEYASALQDMQLFLKRQGMLSE